MLGYRMDVHNADELVERDPFGGMGVFLPSATSEGDEILSLVTDVFGIIPAVAFPGRGAWIDTSAAGLGSSEARARWEARS